MHDWRSMVLQALLMGLMGIALIAGAFALIFKAIGLQITRRGRW